MDAEESLLDADYARLRTLIDACESAGEPRLPPELRLGQQLGVTRGRLRTLLRRAEDDGLIWRHVGRGTFVGMPSSARADGARAADISMDDLFDARLLIEPQLAAQAALHATAADLDAMEACLAQMAVSQMFLHWKRLDSRLHRMIAAAAHNALLLQIFDTLRAPVRGALELRLEQVFGELPGPRASADVEHRAIVQAIAAHDPARAEAAMRAHIASVRHHLFGLR